METFLTDQRLYKWFAQNIDISTAMSSLALPLHNVTITSIGQPLVSYENVQVDLSSNKSRVGTGALRQALLDKLVPIPIGLDLHTFRNKDKPIVSTELGINKFKQLQDIETLRRFNRPWTQRPGHLIAVSFDCSSSLKLDRQAVCSLSSKMASLGVVFVRSLQFTAQQAVDSALVDESSSGGGDYSWFKIAGDTVTTSTLDLMAVFRAVPECPGCPPVLSPESSLSGRVVSGGTRGGAASSAAGAGRGGPFAFSQHAKLLLETIGRGPGENQEYRRLRSWLLFTQVRFALAPKGHGECRCSFLLIIHLAPLLFLCCQLFPEYCNMLFSVCRRQL